VRPYFSSDLRGSPQSISPASHAIQRRERRHPVTPYVSILRMLLPFLAAYGCIASAADDYDVQLVARTGQGFTSFDQRVSINDSGWVAFVGQDSSDRFSKLFVNSLDVGAWGSGLNSVVSIFSGDRLFEGAAINNESPPRIASSDRVSGATPSFFLRRWTASPGGSPNGEVLASSPTHVSSTTGFLDIDDSGSVTFLGLSPGALQLTVFEVASPGVLTPIQVGTTGGPVLRPQSATNTGDVILRDMTGNAIVVFKGSPPQSSPIASVSAACSAGSICFKELGSQPGISADGRVVAFYGVEELQNGNGAIVQQPNIFVSVDPGDGNRVIQRVVAGTLVDTFADLTLAKDQRIGVLNRGGESNLDTVLGDPNAELVTVVFVAALKDPTPGSPLTLPGIYSVDLLYRDLGGTRTLEVDAFRARDIKRRKETFEGRPTVQVKGAWTKETRSFPGGGIFVPVAQPHARLAAHLLEPEGPDSLASWGFFDAVFEQKEYMEDYVLEAVAAEMLKDPKVKAEWEGKLKDPAFAKSPHERLDFFYMKHPSWDSQLGLVPVFRLQASP